MELWEQIPESVRDVIRKRFVEKLVQKGFNEEEILQEIIDLALSEEIKDKQFGGNIEPAFLYAGQVVFVRKMARREQLVKVTVVPIGVSRVILTTRKQQGGGTTVKVPRSRIWVLCKEEGQDKFKQAVILCEGATAKLVDILELFNVYNVILAKSNFEGMYRAVAETKFDQPTSTIEDPEEFLMEKLKIPKITLEETPNNLARVDEHGFVDDFDLRLLEGIIVRTRIVERQSGLIGRYYIADDTVMETTTLDNGLILPVPFRVDCHPRFVKCGVDSSLLFLGHIRVDPGNQLCMDAIAVIPKVCFELE